MHRAVAARMQNPELSLFDALRLGGFDYPADEDANVMDSEKVALGQRKNQLSRRLRLARKQQEESGESDDGKVSVPGGAAQRQAKTVAQQQSNAAVSSEAQRQLEHLIQHSQRRKLHSGSKRNSNVAELADAEINPNDEDTSMMDENKARRMAKFHPQYQPLFIPRAASVRNSFGSNSQSQLQQQLAGTPQLAPLPSPLDTLGGGPQDGNPGLSGSFASTNQSSLFPQAGLLGHQASQKRQGNHPSGVAIASLSATAQSVGLSLEQLAVALSSSSNLVKVLSNNSGSEQQQELALRLYRNESRALYQRCMLLAGFRPEDAEESASAHLQFAFSAWQMEGKRLQELMGEENRNSINGLTGLDAPLKIPQANTPQQLQQQQRQQPQGGQQQQSNPGPTQSHSHQHDNAHEHSHGHDHHHHGDGHHVHQLEGKCGHKAIIHQPKDGSAHIDFVVGDKVECYRGLHPVGNSKSVSIWPSKYKCEDLSCPIPCADQLVDDLTPGDFNEPGSRSAPQILDISDIDLDGTEWNSDLNGSMGGTLLGLFKLGDSDKDSAPAQNESQDNVLVI